MSALFEPLTLRGTRFENRVWIAPMCQYSVEARDGVPTDWHLVHLVSLARGGAGLVVVEATAVSAEGRISPEDTGIWDGAQQAAWTRIVDAAHATGALMGVQLAHAGRKASVFRPWDERRGTVPEADGGWRAVAPSAIAFPGYAVPDALDAAGVRRVVEDFRAATRRAVAAGFDVLEVHAAHGYLLHEFLSPLSNRRDDEWGGSLPNRARLLLDVVRAVRAEAGQRPVVVRFSGTDWAADGWTIEDTVAVAGWCADAGADLFDVSSGGNVLADVPTGPGYQVPLAAAVRAAGHRVGAVGLITDPYQAEAVLADGSADVVSVARPALRNPHLPLEWAEALDGAAPWPRQYERAALPR